MRRIVSLVGAATASLTLLAGPAAACGFLVAPNGSVVLQRTTTLAAYHDGVEHYVTSFAFAGDATKFGSIIPLPGRPTRVERAGDWTLQRLEREVAPVVRAEFSDSAKSSSAGVAVISETHIDSLTVTVVAGGGRAVAGWANANGFALPADTPAALEFYARRSPYFALAKFDARKAVAKGLRSGDGIPVHIAMPLANPWVPLRILAAAKPADEVVQADVFLLTDARPTLLTGAGLELARSEPATPQLLDDLRSDKHSAWIPEHAWFTYLRVDQPAAQLTYDLAIDATGRGNPSIIDTGLVSFRDVQHLHRVSAVPHGSRVWWVVIAVLAGVLLLVSLTGVVVWAVRHPVAVRAR